MELRIVEARADQSDVLARHRCEMWRDMGVLADEHYAELLIRSKRYFEKIIPAQSYVAFLAAPADQPDVIVGGGGVLIRPLMPRPLPNRAGVTEGEQGLILNMYVEPKHRRCGVASALLDHALDWCRFRGIRSVVLNASHAGRPVYERRGFVDTREMGIFLSSLELDVV